MKKKNFITLVLALVGGMLFGVGMCMCLLPEWNAFMPGVVSSSVGGIMLLVLCIVRYKTDGKHFRINWSVVGKTLFGILGALILGVGMCMIMVWHMMVLGIVVGIVGIILLLCLIPMCLGLK
jgi:hypothetical protein